MYSLIGLLNHLHCQLLVIKLPSTCLGGFLIYTASNEFDPLTTGKWTAAFQEAQQLEKTYIGFCQV